MVMPRYDIWLLQVLDLSLALSIVFVNVPDRDLYSSAIVLSISLVLCHLIGLTLQHACTYVIQLTGVGFFGGLQEEVDRR